MALAALVCAVAAGIAGCGSEAEGPPGSTPGDVRPIGELAGPTVPMDDTGFDPLLALTVESGGEGRTLLAGEVTLSRPQGSGAGVPELRIAVDGDREREAEARLVGDDRLVIACACDLDQGEHEVELQGRSVGGVSPVAARALVALDGVEYETDAPTGSGALPPAISGSSLESDQVLVSEAPASIAELDLADGSTSSQKMLVIAEIGSTRSSTDPRGLALQALIGGEEATQIATEDAASSTIVAFTLDTTASPGETVELHSNVVGGGSTELDLRYLIACPCGLETES